MKQRQDLKVVSKRNDCLIVFLNFLSPLIGFMRRFLVIAVGMNALGFYLNRI